MVHTPLKLFLKLLLLIAGIPLVPTQSLAQFNGNFEIERHFLQDESFFDWLAYQPPTHWQREWLQTTSGMQATTGSISQEQFYFYQEIRLQKSITPWFSFSYQLQREEFYREESPYQEVSFRFGKQYYMEIIGFPTHEKKYGDFGVAAAYGDRSETQFLRFSYLQQDLVYNEKNVHDDRHTPHTKYLQSPVFSRLEGHWHDTEKGLIAFSFTHESLAQLADSWLGQIKQYQGGDYRFWGEISLPDSSAISLQGRSDEELRSHLDITSGDLLKHQRLAWSWVDLSWTGFTLGDLEGEMGGNLASFHNDINAKSLSDCATFSLESAQIYGRLQQPLSIKSALIYALQTGRYRLEKSLAGVSDPDDEGLQAKASFGALFFEEKNYHLYFNSTWDLDTIRYRQWDGGNVQLQLYF